MGEDRCFHCGHVDDGQRATRLDDLLREAAQLVRANANLNDDYARGVVDLVCAALGVNTGTHRDGVLAILRVLA